MTAGAAARTLQRLILPDPGICGERALFVRLDGPAGLDLEAGAVRLGPGGRAAYDTYYNAFSVAKWARHCALDDLALVVDGTGEVEIAVTLAPKERTPRLIACRTATLAPGRPAVIDLTRVGLGPDDGCLIHATITAISHATITGGRFEAAPPPDGPLKLAIAITTYRREAAVAATVDRLCRFLDAWPPAAGVHVFVVDNGSSVRLPAHPRVTLVANRNLGGAGGFARGLALARAGGFSHALFMDDDATFLMENLVRCIAFIARARDDRVAVAGAMINDIMGWAMWENGAVFDRYCQPQFCGADLRSIEAVHAIERDSLDEVRPNFYGGFWFLAFPLAHLRHDPFPFFVRGDDISFSIANPFRIVPLNGVVSFQEDFAAKESAHTLYLDLRSHLVHHLVFDHLDRGALGTAWVAQKFVLRSLGRFHYETAEAQLMAWADVLEGPDFFERDLEMTATRARVGALIDAERWRPAAEMDLSHRRRRQVGGGWLHWPLVYTLNGHLMPFYRLWADRIVLPVTGRGRMHEAWGAARITYLNAARDKAYTVEIDRRRFLRLIGRMLRLTWRFGRAYPALRDAYRAAYPHLTAPEAWAARFGPAAAPPPEATPRAPEAHRSTGAGAG